MFLDGIFCFGGWRGGLFLPPPLFVCVVNPGAAAGLRV